MFSFSCIFVIFIVLMRYIPQVTIVLFPLFLPRHTKRMYHLTGECATHPNCKRLYYCIQPKYFLNRSILQTCNQAVFWWQSREIDVLNGFKICNNRCFLPAYYRHMEALKHHDVWKFIFGVQNSFFILFLEALNRHVEKKCFLEKEIHFFLRVLNRHEGKDGFFS